MQVSLLYYCYWLVEILRGHNSLKIVLFFSFTVGLPYDDSSSEESDNETAQNK